MKVFSILIGLGCVALLNSCQKNVTTEEMQDQAAASRTNSENFGRYLKKFGLRSVYSKYEDDDSLMICLADGPIYKKTNFQSNTNRDGRPLPFYFWDARINYNSDKTVFISNRFMGGANDVGLGLLGNDIPVNDTIVFASVYNGRIDYSRAGKLNGYYDKMQYYYNKKGQLSRIVNWTNTRFAGYRVLDFRFTYDHFGNLLSWRDVSPNKIGGVSYSYDYSKPVKNAYYEELRNFIDPPFTIMQQFGLLPDLNPGHLRKSAHITSKYYPEDMVFTYTSQVVDAKGNLRSYMSSFDGRKYLLTWSEW